MTVKVQVRGLEELKRELARIGGPGSPGVPQGFEPGRIAVEHRRAGGEARLRAGRQKCRSAIDYPAAVTAIS